MNLAAPLLLLALSCATAEPEPTPERPLVACGPNYCTVDRGFFAAMTTTLEECQREKPAPDPQKVALPVPMQLLPMPLQLPVPCEGCVTVTPCGFTVEGVQVESTWAAP